MHYWYQPNSGWKVLFRRWIHQWGLQYQPNHIWNVDECGIGDVPQTHKVIGVVGERLFQTVSVEKAVNTTLLTYVNAGGLYVPPMVIFKASRVKPEWREHAPQVILFVFWNQATSSPSCLQTMGRNL